MTTTADGRSLALLCWHCSSCEHYWPFDRFALKPGSTTEPKSRCKACEAIDAIGESPESRDWAVNQMAYLLRAVARSRIDLVRKFPPAGRIQADLPVGWDDRDPYGWRGPAGRTALT